MNVDAHTILTTLGVEALRPIAEQVLAESAEPVDSLVATKIGRSAGLGTLGIFRVTGRATTGQGTRPWSAVVKVLAEPEHDDRRQDYHPLRELDVYRSSAFAELCGGVRTPHCYGVQAHDGLYLLWLEDLSAAPQPPWQPQHFIATAHHLGEFNAHWPADALPTWPWLEQEGIRNAFHGPYHAGIMAKLRLYLDHPYLQSFGTPAHIAALFDLWEVSDTLLAVAEMTTQGVCHRDCHPKNLFPMQDSGQEPKQRDYTIAIDWTKVGLDHYGLDIGHLLASPMTWHEVAPDEAAALVNPMCDAYVEGLQKSGWTGDPTSVRITFLTRLACEAQRNVDLMVYSIERPGGDARLTELIGRPILDLWENWGKALRFYLACKDDALRLANLD